MGKVQTIIVVAVGYLALGAFSAFFAYSDQDAWSVWLTSGLGLGLLLSRMRSDWWPVLVGAFLGALIFEPLVGSTFGDSLLFALIEVVVTIVGGWVASRISATPLSFASTRDVGAVVAGAFALALTGAVLIWLWDYVSGSPDGWRNFRVWLLGNFVAIVLLAPFIASWAQFDFKRVDAPTLLKFAGGIVACVLFVICVHAVFSSHRVGASPEPFASWLTYLPLALFVLVALLWNARGVSLAALIGALIAITQTIRGFGPFIGAAGFFDDPVVNAQGYAVAMSIAGLLVTTAVKGHGLAAAGRV